MHTDRDTGGESTQSSANEAEGLQPRVSVQELAEFRDTGEAQHLARLEADTDLMLRLSAEGFEGRAWVEVSRALAEYGYTVMRAWVVTGHVFIKCREKGLAIETAVAVPRPDALEMAQDTVADAILNFRDYVLKQGRWDPSKGASLTTFFIGNCLLQFPNVHRRWLRVQNRVRRHDPIHGDGRQPAFDAPGGGDPAQEFIARDSSERGVSRLLAPLTRPQREVIELRADGLGVDEIAEALGLGYKQVESLLYRARQRLRGTI